MDSQIHENILKKMEMIPFFSSYESSNKRLNLKNATYFPEEIFEFVEYIEILNISSGSIESLPESFQKLQKLKRLFLGGNTFREVPSILKKLQSLEMLSMKSCRLESFPEDILSESIVWLVLTDNPLLQKLPDSIGKLKKLRKFSLAGTGIQKLPNSLIHCKSLEFLRISASRYTSLPVDILREFPLLAWFGDAGNPYSSQAIGDTPIKKFSEDDIFQGNLINESPSSKVFHGIIKQTGEEIVIKHFKKSMTSDGFAQDDIQASISAGSHPNIIQTYGTIDESRVIFHYIPDSYKKLGLSPSLESCTRDTFPKDISYSPEFILQILICVSSACAHLHSLGISHGDLYAHNILVNDSGNAILGDFGAASSYDKEFAIYYECFDVRAFGNLIEDLVSQVGMKDDHEKIVFLRHIQQTCQNGIPEKFPRFREIHKTLLGYI